MELGVPILSAGRALYNRPVRFLDPNTKVSSSFKTCFSFSVTNVGLVIVSIRDGLAFLFLQMITLWVALEAIWG